MLMNQIVIQWKLTAPFLVCVPTAIKSFFPILTYLKSIGYTVKYLGIIAIINWMHAAVV